MLGVDAESDALDILPIDAGDKPGRRARRRDAGGGRRPGVGWIVGAVVVVAGFAGGAFQFLSSSDDEAADDTAELDGTQTTDAVDFDDLIDGQTVELVVEGLAHSVTTVTVQCVPDTAPDVGCDPTTAHRAFSSPNGTIEQEVAVWRVISTADQQRYDCARLPCELRTYPPRPVASIATSTLGFDPENTAVLPPDISANQASPSTEDLITLRSGALAEGSDVTVIGCRVGLGDDPVACDMIWQYLVPVGTDGLSYDIEARWWQGNFATECDKGCRIDFHVPGVDRQPFSIFLPPSDRAGLLVDTGNAEIPTELTVVPDSGLVDGQEVTLLAEGLTNEMGLYLCADTFVFDCSWLGTPSTADEQTVRVPRAFVSWRGGLRDCAEDDCQIVVLGPMNFEDQVSAPIAFDSSIPLEPGRPLTISTDELIADGETVVISIDPNEGAMEWPNMAVCSIERSETCEYVESNFTDNAVTVTLYRTLMTPSGPYDCIDDGACQLIVWIDGRQTRFEPLDLTFDPDAPPARVPATVTIRPAGELSDGDTISLAVRGLLDDEFVVFASICVTGEARCAFLGGIDGARTGSASLDLRIRRVISMQSSVTPGATVPVDCAEVQCEIRLSNVRAGEPAPLRFNDDPPLPDPEVAVDRTGPLPVNERIEIRGRNFTFITLNDEPRLDVHLCQPVDEPGAYRGCFSIGGISATDIDAGQGTFSGTVIIPEEPSEFRGTFEPWCETDCLLVVFDGAGPPGVLPITIAR